MQFRSPLLLSTLLSTLTTACISEPPYGAYNVTSYQSDCIGGEGCFYSFNVAFVPDKAGTEPAFTASCSGSDAQTTFVACNDTTVLSYVTYGDVPNLFVQHAWSRPKAPHTRGAQYFITGNITVPAITGAGSPSFQIFANEERVVYSS